MRVAKLRADVREEIKKYLESGEISAGMLGVAEGVLTAALVGEPVCKRATLEISTRLSRFKLRTGINPDAISYESVYLLALQVVDQAVSDAVDLAESPETRAEAERFLFEDLQSPDCIWAQLVHARPETIRAAIEQRRKAVRA